MQLKIKQIRNNLLCQDSKSSISLTIYLRPCLNQGCCLGLYKIQERLDPNIIRVLHNNSTLYNVIFNRLEERIRE